MLREFCSGKKIEINREVKAILRKILKIISENARIEETREFIMSLYPVAEEDAILERQNLIRETMLKLSNIKIEELKKLLAELPKVEEKITGLKDRILIVNDDEEEVEARKIGICEVIRREDVDEEVLSFPLILSTEDFEIGERFPIVVSISLESLAPDELLKRIVEGNCGRKYLEVIRKFPSLFEKPDPEFEKTIEMAEKAFEKVKELKSVIESLDKNLEKALEEINERIKDRLEEMEIKLKGTDLLELYQGYLEGVQPISEGIKALEEIIEEEIEKECTKLLDLLGFPAEVFTKTYPVELDRERVEELKSFLEREFKESLFKEAEKIEGALNRAIKFMRKIYEKAIWVDFCLSIILSLGTSFSFPELFEGGIGFLNAKSLFIENPQPISYFLGDLPAGINLNAKRSRVAILTGANSGGKTTLLETFATIVLLAQMGLPVPAERAWFDPVECIKMFKAKRKIEGAGALESVLKFLTSLALEQKRKLILIDELIESVTEPGAAAKILGKVLEIFLEEGAYCIVVSHLGEDLLRVLPEVRVDGIEAEGLSEDLSLIVNRQPKFGKMGKSTPELIVERLYLKGRGREKEVLGKILEAFRKES